LYQNYKEDDNNFIERLWLQYLQVIDGKYNDRKIISLLLDVIMNDKPLWYPPIFKGLIIVLSFDIVGVRLQGKEFVTEIKQGK